MPTSQPIAISQEALLALPHADLIALYNTESRRLAGSLDVHTVDETFKPLYIVKLMAKLPIRYRMMAETKSNERAAMMPLPVINEVAESKPSKTENRIEKAGLTHGNKGFSLMR